MSLLRTLLAACFLLLVLLLAPAVAVAQDEAAGPPQKSWVVGYFLVILGVALGIAALGVPSGREYVARPKKETEEEEG